MAADPPPVSPPPPPGFVHVLRAPFVNHVGPLLQREENLPGRMTLGLRVATVHTNTMGFMHGGMIATICDSAMARATISAMPRRTVTLRMGTEFFEPVKTGAWLEAHARLVNHDENVAHTECLIMVGNQMCARSTGIFRLLRKV
ncbi:MAG: PaaI family thioesterase [Hyphomonadaceae bacterium]|nr:PaaI family thioesterase [Hyphomonadaceae bacterium]